MTNPTTPDQSCYPGEGVRTVVQDWVVRQWPSNFEYWLTLPPPPASVNGEGEKQ